MINNSRTLDHNEADNTLALSFIIISSILYGFLGFFGTNITSSSNSPMSISTMLFWRFLIASFFTYFFWNKKYQSVLKNKNAVLFAFFNGGFLYFFSAFFYFKSSLLIGTGLAMVIFFSYPAFVIILYILFHKKYPSIIILTSILILTIGFILLANSENFKFNLLGIFWAATGAIGYALYIFQGKRQINKLDPVTTTFFACLGCTSVSLIMSLIDNSLVLPSSSHSWMNILAIAILCTSLPIFLMLRGLKKVDAGKASILSALEPVVTVVIGISFLSESITFLQTIGATLLIFSAILIQFDKKKIKLKKY